jgi:hypothetical protein
MIRFVDGINTLLATKPRFIQPRAGYTYYLLNGWEIPALWMKDIATFSPYTVIVLAIHPFLHLNLF